MSNRKSMGSTPKTGRPSFVPTPGDSLLVQECIKCSCKLSPKDKGLHNEAFCNSIKDNVSSAIKSADHGFILASSLHAIVSDIEIKNDEWPTHIADAKNRVLLMNESAMEYLAISSGDIVHVTLDDLTTSLFAYTASCLKGLCKVVLPDSIHNRYLNCTSLCSVKKIVSQCIASRITLSADCSDFNSMNAVMSLRKRLLNLNIFEGMQVFIDLSSNQYKFTVTSVTRSQGDVSEEISKLSMKNDTISICQMKETSRVFIDDSVNIPGVTFKDVAGLDKQIRLMNKYIVCPVREMNQNHKIEYSLPHGILLHGFTGTGKTLTMNAFINEHTHSLYCLTVDSASLIAKSADASEQKISSLFTLAIDQAPSVIFIDRLEVICSGRKSQTDMEKQLTYFLLTQFDALNRRRRQLPNSPLVTVVGVTNQLDCIDTCFKGPGKFEVEIEFPIPVARDRREIMNILLSRGSHEIASEEFEEIAADAFGFTGADLESVISRAYSDAIEEGAKLNVQHLKSSMKVTKPSAMKEIILEVPAVYWREIGGVESIKKKLEQMVVWPFKYSSFLASMGVDTKKGILMYGPPGCSKTMIGKALATEYKLNFLSIKGPELFNKFVGESEKSVRDLFKRARQAAPSIIFFDEIDALAPERSLSASSNSNVSDRVLAQLLTELDGIEARSEVIVVAATNRPDMIDPALKRPGRLDCEIYVPLPDERARKEILTIKTRNMPLDETVDIKRLVSLTAGYSGAEMTALCTETGFTAASSVIDNLPPGGTPQLSQAKVTMDMFMCALDSIKPRTNKQIIEFFENYSSKSYHDCKGDK